MASTIPADKLRRCRRRHSRDYGFQAVWLHAERLRNMGWVTRAAADGSDKSCDDQAYQNNTIHGSFSFNRCLNTGIREAKLLPRVVLP